MENLPPTDASQRRPGGPIAWMARNSVAANLLMAVLVVGGLIFLSNIKQEVFPQFTLDTVSITVPYPGASPEEVEKAVTRVIEENVRGLDGVKSVKSTSQEGSAVVNVELMLDSDRDRALNDIKAAVDRIASFPEDAERPVVSLTQFRNHVLSLIVYGDIPEKSLRAIASRLRDGLLQRDGISQAELGAVRPFEISIEVPRENLRSYGLTLEQVANAVRAANIELPAGGIKTSSGEILLRTSERRDWGVEFANIIVLSRADGTQVRLSDIAEVEDGFAESDQFAYYDGARAAMIQVFRVGDQTPIEVSDAVHDFLEKEKASLPPGVKLAAWDDRSEMFRQRVDLLMRNGYMGLALVLLCLGVFLELRLAFWVTMGIPISFLGALLLLPSWDVSINMISLFAFIVTLGIVVDDAIVVGEAIYKRRRDGLSLMEAAVVGTQDVAKPVIFSVLTTIVAFSPLLFVPGVMGKFFRNIPVVVIAVLLLSLVESLLVLPAHLSHENRLAAVWRRKIGPKLWGDRLGPFGWLHRAQQRFSDRFEAFVEGRVVPISGLVARYRYITLAAGFALLVSSCGFVASGRIEFTFLPKIESDIVAASLTMPYGTPAETTEQHMRWMLETSEEVFTGLGGRDANVRSVFAQVGAAGPPGGARGAVGNTGSHLAEVAIFMKPSDQRNISSTEVVQRWREKIGQIPGAESLKFRYTTGASGSAPISIQLSHGDVPTLERAARELAAYLGRYHGVREVDDGVDLGKIQLDFELTPEARALGITEQELARQVRSAFFGAEASRQQRGREEVRAYVRLPKSERSSLHDLDELLIRSPAGGEIPLKQAAEVIWGRAYTAIVREDGRRVITVEADVVTGEANANKVMDDVQAEALPELVEKYPQLTTALGGQQKEQAESLGALADGFKLAIIVMFALMAIPFRSYVQPAIIMFSIPFGVVGALGGHLLMGYDLSILSMMGLVALGGVVVNDSLVLISAVNELRLQGMTATEAVVAGSARRFRPILLTSLTTFLGLAPMIFETSVQARFLVPMALSLGFGVLFATVVSLVFVPCLYLILEDILGGWRTLTDDEPTVGEQNSEDARSNEGIPVQ